MGQSEALFPWQSHHLSVPLLPKSERTHKFITQNDKLLFTTMNRTILKVAFAACLLGLQTFVPTNRLMAEELIPLIQVEGSSNLQKLLKSKIFFLFYS